MGNEAKISRVFSGKIQKVPFKKIVIETAIFKQEIKDKVYVNKLGIESDEQGDKKYHGGVEQALCVYLEESYKYWTKYKEHNINCGSFGENIVLTGYNEDDIFIGDRFKLGNVVAQVSQPRQPCSRLGLRNNWDEMVIISRNSKLTGFYLRILEEGHLQMGDTATLLSREANSISITEINRLLYEQDVTIDELKRAIAINTLGAAFKKDLTKKLNKMEEKQRVQ